MRIAVISDVHGNLVALEAVLDDLSSSRYDGIVCLGDVALRGPQPRECLQIVQGLDCQVIMGNTDSFLIKNEPAWIKPDDLDPMMHIDLWCVDQLSAPERAFIQTFQPTIEMPLGSTDSACFFHASPRDNAENIFSTTAEVDLEEMIYGCAASVLAGGHTHIQMLRRKYDKTVVNVGSVGRPFLRHHLDTWNSFATAPWAEYAMIDYQAGQLSVDFRRVPIDLDELNQAALDSGMPHAEWWCSRIDRNLAGSVL